MKVKKYKKGGKNDPKKKGKLKELMAKAKTKREMRKEGKKPIKKMTPKKPDASKVLDSQIKTEERRNVRQTGMLVRGGKESGDKRDFFGGTDKQARLLAEKNLGRGALKNEDSVKRMKDKGRSGYRNVTKANLAKKLRK